MGLGKNGGGGVVGGFWGGRGAGFCTIKRGSDADAAFVVRDGGGVGGLGSSVFAEGVGVIGRSVCKCDFVDGE